jgi:hypothetical protein
MGKPVRDAVDWVEGAGESIGDWIGGIFGVAGQGGYRFVKFSLKNPELTGLVWITLVD